MFSCWDGRKTPRKATQKLRIKKKKPSEAQKLLDNREKQLKTLKAPRNVLGVFWQSRGKSKHQRKEDNGWAVSGMLFDREGHFAMNVRCWKRGKGTQPHSLSALLRKRPVLLTICIYKQRPADGVWRIGRGCLQTGFERHGLSAGPPQRAPKQCPANGVLRIL